MRSSSPSRAPLLDEGALRSMTSSSSAGDIEEHKTASPVRGSLGLGGKHHGSSASNPLLKSNSGNHLSTAHLNEATYLGVGALGGAGSNSSSRSGSSPPHLNPIAKGRGYPINSPAHDPAHTHLVLHNKPIHHLSYRSTDFTLMSQLFGGYPLAALTQFSITIFSYVSLWVTAAIFAQSVDTLFFQYILGQDCNIYVENQSAGCYTGYYIIVAIYSVIVIFLSLKDLTETASMQAVLTGYRFAAFFAMGATCLVASVYPNYFDSPDGKHPAAWSPFRSARASEIPTVEWSQFDSIFTISVVSLMVQYNMPDIITPMRTPYKRHESGVVAVLLGCMMACVALYIGLGLICSLTIGMNSYPLITLNWSHYTGYDGGWGLVPAGSDVYWWAQLIKLFIMLFPVINMLSVFPLVAISLSENLRSSIPARFAKQHAAEDLKRYCRILACVPPLILTCFNGQIDLIFKVAGFVAFLIQLIIPCLLQWLSIRYCKRIWGEGSEETPFSFRLLSNQFSVFVVFLIGCGFAAYSVVGMVNEDAATAS